MKLSAVVETKLQAIRALIEEIEERRAEERSRAGDGESRESPCATAGTGRVTALVAIAPAASTPPAPAENLVKSTPKREKTNQVRVS